MDKAGMEQIRVAQVGGGLWLAVFLPYACGYFLSYLLRNVNAVMAPTLSAELGISSAELGLLTGAYLAAFAAAQLPLGILLDRHGPRRVQAALLLVAALGCGLYAVGQSLAELIVARALIGLGVSGCLMGAYKAFSQSFPVERLASLNAAIMVAGGLGALTASSPFSLLLPRVGWRWIFAGLVAVALLAAWLVTRTPERAPAPATVRAGGQTGGLSTILGKRSFWRFAPMAALMIGGFIAVQGLWAVPWLTDAAGMSRDGAAFCLVLLNVALMVGYTAMATLLPAVQRRGWTLGRIQLAGGAAALLLSLALILGLGPVVLWVPLGLAFSTTNLVYAQHASRYPLALSGRANTCLNLGVFIGGFGLQWGFGILVDAAQAGGLERAPALSAAWGVLLALQAASLAWFAATSRWEAAGREGRAC